MTAAVFAGLAPAAHAWPAEFELSRLLPENSGNGSEGFVLEGLGRTYLPAPYYDPENLGRAGDLNADGVGDLIIGGPNFGVGAVFYGRDTARVGLFDPVFDLEDLSNDDGSAGFEFRCVGAGHPECYSPERPRGVGDLNGDGITDLFIDASYPAGFILFGNRAGFPPEFDLSSLLSQYGGDGTAGFTIDGATGSIAAGGDVNHDGLSDLIFGSPFGDPDGMVHAVYVLFGRPDASARSFPAQFDLGSLLAAQGGDGSKGFVLNGIVADDDAGAEVATGDINGDGIPDIVLGATAADPGGRASAGDVFVVFGQDVSGGATFPPEFELSSLLAAQGGDGSAGLVLHGVDAEDQTGTEVAAADLNGDGIGDVIASAEEADPGGHPDAGRVYVVFGRRSGFPAEIELADLLAANGGDGSEGFVLNGYPDNATIAISAGRVNGDGIDDVILGAPGVEIFPPYAGRVYVMFGRDASQEDFPAELELSSLLAAYGGDGTQGFVLNGVHAGDLVGDAVSASGDVNGDGFDDIIVNASFENQWPFPYHTYLRGRSYVLFGGEGNLRDDDRDGVSNDVDVCSNTSIPERVPLVRLAEGRYAIVDGDNTFDIGTPSGPAPSSITLTDTLGCSCGQIIAQLGHGRNERRFGCTQQTMDHWTDLVHTDARMALGLHLNRRGEP